MRFSYEHRSAPLLSRRKFYRRMWQHGQFAALLMALSLGLGMLGYVTLARMSVVDAFLNAAMLLGGMGPVGDLPTTGAKIFAGCYALYAGVVFIATAGILIAPAAHRLLHTFHVEGADPDGNAPKAGGKASKKS